MSRLAQLVERKTFNLVVVGSSPTVGGHFLFLAVPPQAPGWGRSGFKAKYGLDFCPPHTPTPSP